ncbi:MAG TPA: metallophosphoesterase [Natronosporangium sp.]
MRRPTSLDPYELGFTPRPPVAWLAPLQLLRTSVRAALATTFGAYLDKRELQGVLPSRSYRQEGEHGELWLDYVADCGDGFNATYSVAYLLGQPSLTVDGHQLPRGQVLIMGGDQVYPTASMQEYEDRLKGPYTAALPMPPPDGAQPTLYALPGNHDWYDGLTAFLRLFVGERINNIGGWRTEQSRSYFAISLPHRWWLFAIDEAYGAYLDDPQLVYFEQVAKQLGPDDRVILAAPAPTWGKLDPKGYNSIDYFIRNIITPTGAQLRMLLAGDQHHYARYTGPDRELVTAGGGGAYLIATHNLPERITVPPPETIVRKASPRKEYELAGRFPDAARSRRLGWGVFARLPWRNPGFTALVGAVHMLLMLAVAGAASHLEAAEERLVTIPLVVMVLLVLAGTVGLAYIPTGGPKHPRHFLAGTLHGVVHLGLGLAGGLLWLELPFADWAWPLPLLAAAVLYLPVAGLVGSQLVAAYLLIASAFQINVNELFAAQGIEDYKSFLRLHIGRDGSLTIYPIAVERICRQWRADPDAERPESAWIVPADPAALKVRLAEPPIRIS